MRCPKSTVPDEKLSEKLKNFDIFENGALKKKKDCVWQSICNSLGKDPARNDRKLVPSENG